MKGDKMDRKEAFARIEEERRQKQQKESQERREYREKERWDKIHWKERGWGASYEKQDAEFWKSPRYEYALWYYHRWYKFLIASVVPLLLFVYFAIRFILSPAFSYYLDAVLFFGIATALLTVDDENEDHGSYYEFYSTSLRYQMGVRAAAFLGGFLFMPIIFIKIVGAIVDIISNKNFPVPYKIKSEDYGPSYKKIGKVDDEGNIYRRID
jgi:hypothetical protein